MAYRVRWEIDLEEPETPLAAAREAHAIMLDPDSTATVFTVTAPDGATSMIDLLSAISSRSLPAASASAPDLAALITA